MSEADKAWEDTEREEGALTLAERHGDSFSVTSSNGWSIGVPASYGVEPKVGDRFVTWGSFGRPVRGMALNGRVLYYRTPAEQDAEDQRQADAHKAERIAEYESKRADFDRRVAALPAPLRERIEGFRAFKGEAWRWEFEPYEMACCEEAARIAARFNTADAVRSFAKLPYEAQKQAHPTMDDGHSGNTWGTALRLAVLLCERPELVARDHAGICALVGCEDAGCFAARAGGAS
jgi:hypothetical protein